MKGREAHNHAPVDSNNEVKPWLNSKLQTFVPKYLEAKSALVRILGWRIRVEARDKAIECVEHSFKWPVGYLELLILECFQIK